MPISLTFFRLCSSRRLDHRHDTDLQRSWKCRPEALNFGKVCIGLAKVLASALWACVVSACGFRWLGVWVIGSEDRCAIQLRHGRVLSMLRPGRPTSYTSSQCTEVYTGSVQKATLRKRATRLILCEIL